MYIFLNNDFACICMHIFVFLLLSFIIFNQGGIKCPTLKNMLDLLFAYVQTKLTFTKIKMTLVQ